MKIDYLYGGRLAQVQSAAGTRGVLIRTVDGEILSRVYQGRELFTDYEIRNDDLTATVDEAELTVFYRINGNNILDHSPQVLGLEMVKDI